MELAPPKNWASPADWERFRPLIKRLYVQEERTLKEVINTMARDHRHYGTVKMYKLRITKWGLDKNHKECDMRAILRKKTQRDAVGKSSSFRVRERTVEIEEVITYFRRRGVSDFDKEISCADTSTPPAVSWWTPSPSPSPSLSPRLRPVEQDMNTVDSSQGLLLLQYDANLAIESRDVIYQQASSYVRLPASPIIKKTDAPFPRLKPQVWKDSDFDALSFKIQRSLLPPQGLLKHEILFFNIRDYFEAAFESGTFVTGTDGHLYNACKPVCSKTSSYSDFFAYCEIAFQFLRDKKFIQSRRLLSKACELVEIILRQEDPRTLESLLDTYVHLGRQFPETATILRNYVGKMAECLFPANSPWRQILSITGMMDDVCLEQVFLQSWHSGIEIFQKAAGKLNPTCISSYVDYIIVSQDPSTASRMLKSLAEEAEKTLSVSDHAFRSLQYAYGQSLCQQGEYREALIIMEYFAALCQEACDDYDQILALESVALCLDRIGRLQDTEMTLRQAFELSKGISGKSSSLTLHLMSMLSSKLQRWGRQQESEAIQADINKLLGPDDIDGLES